MDLRVEVELEALVWVTFPHSDSFWYPRTISPKKTTNKLTEWLIVTGTH